MPLRCRGRGSWPGNCRPETRPRPSTGPPRCPPRDRRSAAFRTRQPRSACRRRDRSGPGARSCRRRRRSVQPTRMSTRRPSAVKETSSGVPPSAFPLSTGRTAPSAFTIRSHGTVSSTPTTSKPTSAATASVGEAAAAGHPRPVVGRQVQDAGQLVRGDLPGDEASHALDEEGLSAVAEVRAHEPPGEGNRAHCAPMSGEGGEQPVLRLRGIGEPKSLRRQQEGQVRRDDRRRQRGQPVRVGDQGRPVGAARPARRCAHGQSRRDERDDEHGGEPDGQPPGPPAGRGLAGGPGRAPRSARRRPAPGRHRGTAARRRDGSSGASAAQSSAAPRRAPAVQLLLRLARGDATPARPGRDAGAPRARPRRPPASGPAVAMPVSSASWATSSRSPSTDEQPAADEGLDHRPPRRHRRRRRGPARRAAPDGGRARRRRRRRRAARAGAAPAPGPRSSRAA